jgi:hypothetical protein
MMVERSCLSAEATRREALSMRTDNKNADRSY